MKRLSKNISGLRKLSINFNQDEKVDYISMLFIGKEEMGVWCFGETVMGTQHLYHKCFVYWYEQETALVCQNWCLWELSVEHNAPTQETLKTETVGLFFEASLTPWKLRKSVPFRNLSSFEYSKLLVQWICLTYSENCPCVHIHTNYISNIAPTKRSICKHSGLKTSRTGLSPSLVRLWSEVGPLLSVLVPSVVSLVFQSCLFQLWLTLSRGQPARGSVHLTMKDGNDYRGKSSLQIWSDLKCSHSIVCHVPLSHFPAATQIPALCYQPLSVLQTLLPLLCQHCGRRTTGLQTTETLKIYTI